MVLLRLAPIVIAVACAAYLAWARYPIGLDFQGGAHAVYSFAGDPGTAEERVRTIVHASPLAGAHISRRGDKILIEAVDAGYAEAAPVFAALAQRERVGFHELASGREGRHVRSSAGEQLVVIDPPVIPDSAIASVSVTGDPAEVVLEFTPDGAALLAEVTGRMAGRRLALVIGEDLVMAPVVEGKIPHGKLAFHNPDDRDPAALAHRIRVAVGPSLTGEFTSFVEPALASWQGRSLALALALAAVLAWLVTLLVRRALLGIVATFVTGWALAIATLLYLGGTLTAPFHVTGAIAGTLAALGAGFAARAGLDRPRSRLVAAWPAGAALLATYVTASILIAAKLLPHSFFGFGVKWLVLALPVTAVLATIAAVAVPPIARSA